MNTLIIEDELLAAERIQLLVKQYDPSIRVAGVLDSVEQAVQWLRTHPEPDLIFLDIQLADGSAFDIFKQVKINRPVIFTTAFDQYALEAFRVLSIDYLLKPVTMETLSGAINKLKSLRQPAELPGVDYQKLVSLLAERPAYKTRYTGRLGSKIHFIETREISFFEADNKVVYLVRMDGYRFLIDQTLEQLESMLDPKLFFRISRSVILHIASILQAKPYVNSRLTVAVKAGPKTEELIVSRERVNDFRSWADS